MTFQLLLDHLFVMLFTITRDNIFQLFYQVLKFKVVFLKELDPEVRVKGEGVPWQLCYWVAVWNRNCACPPKKKKFLQEIPVMILRWKALEEPGEAGDRMSFIISVK